MVKKVCPYCDQVMTEERYCRGCKRIVLKPVFWDVDYYLNERHPESEAQCQYHGDLHTGEMGNKKAAAGGRTTKNMQARTGTGTRAGKGTESQRKPWSSVRFRVPAGTKASENRKKSAAGSLRSLGIVFAVYAALMLITAGFKIYRTFQENSKDIINMFTSESEPQPEPAWEEKMDIYGDTEPEKELSVWERSDKEVKAAGIPCNGYGHFGAGEEEVKEIFEGLLANSSFGWSVERYSTNQFIEGSTWYNTTYEYDLDHEGTYCGFVELNFDTVDGRMHGMSLVFDEAADMYEAADIALAMLGQLEILDEPQDGRSVFENALKNETGSTENFRLQDDIEVYGGMMSDGLYLLYIEAKQP